MNILLTANETGQNNTVDEEMSQTSLTDSFRLCKEFLSNVYLKDSFVLQVSHWTFSMSPQLSPLLFPLSLWRCLALVQARKALAQSLQEDVFL